jgi:RNA polymerase sigma-70 factor (ECF subfamily)
VELAATGDERAFEVLVRRHRAKIMSTILTVVKDRDVAEDLYQDAMIKVYTVFQRGEYDEKGRFLPWALRVARNMAIDQFRRGQRAPMIHAGDNSAYMDHLCQHSDSQERLMIQDENRRAVRRMIRQLPEVQRHVLIMRMYNQMSFKEIAEMTDVSINTALGRMRYALANLRRMCEQQGIVA